MTVVRKSLAKLIDEITVDAFGVGEELSAFLQVFQDEVAFPVGATVLDMAVEVAGIDWEGDERRGLVARCRRRGAGGTVSLADVHFEPDSIVGWLHAAYRSWLDLPPFPARRPPGWTGPGS